MPFGSHLISDLTRKLCQDLSMLMHFSTYSVLEADARFSKNDAKITYNSQLPVKGMHEAKRFQPEYLA